MPAARPQLSEDNIRDLLALKHSDITLEWLKRNFAYVDNKQRIPIEGEFTLKYEDIKNIRMPKFKVGNTITTTAGRFVTNAFLFGDAAYTQYLSYINEPFTKKIINTFNQTIANRLLEEQIKPLDYTDFLDRENWYAYVSTDFIVAGFSSAAYKEVPAVKKLKERLLEENKEAIEKVDMKTCQAIDKQLNEAFTEAIANEPVMDYCKSGAAKNVLGVSAVMRGLVGESKDGLKLHFIKSSLQEGIGKDEQTDYGDVGFIGAIGRGADTARGGYLTKKFNAAFSHITIDDAGSDCHTKFTKEIVIDKNSQENYYLRYVIHQGKEILLTEENIKNLQGEKVKLRTPLYCINDKICNKCAGELFYRLGAKRVGFLISKLGNQLMNACLKGFHESTIKINKIELDDFLTKIE